MNDRILAEQGSAGGQYNLGWKYRHGFDASQDDTQAVFWYRKAAEQGYNLAQTNLGVMYYNGQGVPKNSVVAYALFNLAERTADTNYSNRDIVAKELTPKQLVAGQRLSNEMAKPNSLNKAIAAYLKSNK